MANEIDFNSRNFLKAHYATPCGKHIEYWFEFGKNWASAYQAIMKEKGRMPYIAKGQAFTRINFDENKPEDKGEHQDLSDTIVCTEDATLYFIDFVGREKAEAYEVVDKGSKPSIGKIPLTREATIQKLKNLNIPKDEMTTMSFIPPHVPMQGKTIDPNSLNAIDDIINGTNSRN